ncbi:MAG: stalk domain-containing protein [Armatimonadota bacterium]
MRALLPMRIVVLSAMGLFLFGALPLLAAGPKLQILQPTDGQVVQGPTLPLAVSFECTDGAVVLRFDAYVDTTLLIGGKMSNAIPVGSFRLTPEQEPVLAEIGVKPGVHTLYVQLTDSKGNITKVTQKFTFMPVLRPEKNPPTVRIIEPKDGAKITEDGAKIRVDATDDTAVKWVMIFVGDTMRLWSTEGPFQWTWDPVKEKAQNSMYTIRARAADVFDNMGSHAIKVRVELPFATGLTGLEKDPADAHVPVTAPDDPRFLTVMLKPQYGTGLNRPQASNEITRFTEWVANMLVPEMGPSGARPLDYAVATGGIVALLPPKALPGQAAMLEAGALTLGVTSAPVLAALPTQSARALFASGHLTPAAGALLLPVELLPASRMLSTDTPMIALVSPATAKEMPPTRGTTTSVTAGTASMTVALSGPQLLEGAPARPGAGLQAAPSQVSGTLTRPGVQSLAAGMTPARATAAETPVILMAAVVPVKGTPHASAATSPALPAPKATASTSLQPNPGPGHERAMAGLHPLMFAGYEVAVPTTAGVSAGGGSAEVPSPVLIAALPGKASPGLSGAQAEPATSPALGQQTDVKPGFTPTPRATGGEQGDLPTVKTTLATPPNAAVTPSPRVITVEMPGVATPGVPGKTAPASAKPVEQTAPGTAATAAALKPHTGGTLPAPPQTAVLPTPAATTEAPVMEIERPITVGRSETLIAFAKANNTTPEELIKLNPGLSPQQPLPEGTRLLVPAGTARIYLDNAPIVGGPNPFVRSGVSMVPLRQIVEAKEGTVVWLPQTREVNAWANNTFMSLMIGKKEARINSANYLLPIAPTIREQRTMVPLTYLLTALNLQVEYNPALGTYYLISRAGK